MCPAILEKICLQYGLGNPVCEPFALKGGFLHKMYALFTPTGKYAVKLLNPHIMQRKTAMENYRTAERLEMLLEENKVPIIPALVFANGKMQQLEGQFFYLYPWYDGKALSIGDIREFHCRKIGRLLAQIHGLERRSKAYIRSPLSIDWDFYIERLAVANPQLGRLLQKNRSLLYELAQNGNLAVSQMPPVLSVCHNDMDAKNVLWEGKDCRIIDLECLDYNSPFLELMELALCWSGCYDCRIDYELFRCFLHAYAEAGGTLPADWETVYWCNNSRLEWLEYNCKRSLGIECAAGEVSLGISEAIHTMAQIVYYRNAFHSVIKNCPQA